MNFPQHVAIIMDGNGRWAKQFGYPRIYGHLKGAKAARKIIRACGEVGIRYLTLYTFSTENWKRPTHEVQTLFKILKKYMIRERDQLMKDNVHFQCIGDLSRLPVEVAKEVQTTIDLTKANTGLTLIFALNYGGRQEMMSAMKAIAEDVKNGVIETSDITENLVNQKLQTKNYPEPDLIIRTSGEFRISNFLLWQSAYSEFFVTPTLWPDFDKESLMEALREFNRRDRRFGTVSPNVTFRNKSSVDLDKPLAKPAEL